MEPKIRLKQLIQSQTWICRFPTPTIGKAYQAAPIITGRSPLQLQQRWMRFGPTTQVCNQAQQPPVQPNTAHQIDAYPNSNDAPMILPQNLNPSFHGQQIPQVVGIANANKTTIRSSTASKTSCTDSDNTSSTTQITSKTTRKCKFGIYICEMVDIRWWGTAIFDPNIDGLTKWLIGCMFMTACGCNH